ncbi:uncharacterized protein LOC134728686 isoform X2 [Pan paniscus]|uniref:uncharacterized protein LOC134728686 isoform X2 n=1 Tax=Pan paniscus TaxID=9597 RepID=UPI0015603E76
MPLSPHNQQFSPSHFPPAPASRLGPPERPAPSGHLGLAPTRLELPAPGAVRGGRFLQALPVSAAQAAGGYGPGPPLSSGGWRWERNWGSAEVSEDASPPPPTPGTAKPQIFLPTAGRRPCPPAVQGRAQKGSPGRLPAPGSGQASESCAWAAGSSHRPSPPVLPGHVHCTVSICLGRGLLFFPQHLFLWAPRLRVPPHPLLQGFRFLHRRPPFCDQPSPAARTRPLQRGAPGRPFGSRPSLSARRPALPPTLRPRLPRAAAQLDIRTLRLSAPLPSPGRHVGTSADLGLGSGLHPGPPNFRSAQVPSSQQAEAHSSVWSREVGTPGRTAEPSSTLIWPRVSYPFFMSSQG